MRPGGKSQCIVGTAQQLLGTGGHAADAPHLPGVQLGVGGSGDLTGHGARHLEPATVAGLIGRTRQKGAVDTRHTSAGEDGRTEMLHGVLVAQILLQHGRGQVLLGQGGLIGLLVELAGDGVEEGRDLTDLLDDQFLARPDAGLPGPVQEA